MRWWYLSFADDDNHGGWLGALIIQGTSFEDAVDSASYRGLNPGGEVRGMRMLASALEHTPECCRNRLLTMADMEEYFDGVESWK